jgi:hypothetical protein
MTEVKTDPRKTVDERLQFEMLLTELLARFVRLPADHVGGAIEEAQRHIVEALGIDRSTLFQYSE